MIGRVLDDKAGLAVVSVILGLGLAFVFKTACKGPHCHVVRAPPIADLKKYHYKVDDDCYKYTPYVVPCKGDR